MIQSKHKLPQLFPNDQSLLDRLIQRLKKRKDLFILFLLSLTIAWMSHLFFITEWFDGRYMTGINDGLSQMLPFKQLLYDQYKSGEFFYSPNFGLGGSTYTLLGYYFSMSIVFMVTAFVTFLLESAQVIDEPDLYYWADLILVISVIRLTIIIMLTTFYFRYMQFSKVPAFTGAVVYGTSIIYFRHVTYWEFFADAMIWLPLLLIGVEKIIRERKAGWFILAVSISLFDNFYFSYVDFLLAGFYILFRWMIRLRDIETSKWTQIKLYLLSGLSGIGISAVSFVPSVHGYLNNYRPPYEDPVPVFDFVDNLLLNGRIVYLPAFVLLSLFLFSFYRHRLFRFYASIIILLIFMHYSPFIGSVFNGFSAPQYRWEYFLSLAAGGMTASALEQLGKIKKWQLVLSSAMLLMLYALIYFYDPTMEFTSLKSANMAISAGFVVFVVYIYAFTKSHQVWKGLIIIIVVSCVSIANFFQEERLTKTGTEYRVSKEFMQSDLYNGKQQEELIRFIQSEEQDSLARVDWMIETRNNTPIVQDFKGFSVYSSILNKNLLLFYLNDLGIDMGRESVSRYASLGDRANLYSMLMGKYYVAERGDDAIPYGFSEFASVGKYVAYQNQNMLPFVRTTGNVFSEEALLGKSLVEKERAMLTGIVLKGKSDDMPAAIPASKNIINHAQIEAVNAKYENGLLKVTGKEGGVDLVLDQLDPSVKDLYVSFYIKDKGNIKGNINKEEFTLQVNEYRTTRKEMGSTYRTNVNKITVRIAAKERIEIRVPKGSYEFNDFNIYEENYDVLEAVKDKYAEKPAPIVSWSGNSLSFTVDNEENDQFALIPVPFEKGWSVKVNGEKQEVLKANYAFIGIKLQEGINEVKLVYYPPYFLLCLVCSLGSLSIVIFYLRRKRKIKRAIHQ
ncbi:YfhO family protein [Cytobacillus depressus]|uniref:YfhO family protein n=1 Tax=Cytobacillus depressus TaxID=1602942 RepID=A0A6L3V1Y2_9BACI|nr:YfhO family protein [Cytobacillus depressus]KAB2332144.1 YfhO family protein [Cytobacillus depressus]